MSTVLLRRGALGDVVLLGAVTAALGDAVVVTDRRFVSLARRLRGVVDAVPWPAPGERLPEGRIVDLQGSLRSLRVAPFARRIYKHSLRRQLWLRGWAGPRPSVPALYAAACGVAPAPGPWIDTPPGPREALALIPGAAWGPKRWSSAGFAAVGRAWDGPVVVLGGPGEADEVAAVAAAIPGAAALVEEGFDATIAALGRARVAVGGDTGLVHLAAACGAAVVALFGPTHPDDGFFVHRGEVVQRDLPCRPCALHRVPRCPLGHRACLAIPPEPVIAAVRRCAG